MRTKAAFLTILMAVAVFCAQPAMGIENRVVCKEDGRFGGWPANNGMWSWGDELVVGFTLGYYKKNPTGGHDIDRDKPSVTRQARSLDGGMTWTLEVPGYVGEDGKESEPVACPGGVNFEHPDFAARFKGGRFYYSLDRCRSWEGPFTLPDFGRKGLLARTDYIVEGPRRLTAFIATEKDQGGEGWPCCIRTTDGGKTWQHIGWIGKQPPQGYGYSIMPSTISLEPAGYFSMIRRGGRFDGEKMWWLEAYVSPDEGGSWYLLDQPRIDNAGNPAAMIRLRDGRIALTYGWRHDPYGIRAMISDDNGQTWGPEIVLRKDGASWDLGYPRTVQREDGKCVTAYYYHHPDQPERYIACTIWDPGWIEDVAWQIHRAWDAQEPMPVVTARHPETTLADAYAIQKEYVARILETDAIGGYKAAMVGAAGQERRGLDGPVTGVVPASGVRWAESDVVYDLSAFPNMKVETEIGYVFSKPVTRPLPDEAALREHVASVGPVLEVPGGLTEEGHPSNYIDEAAWNVKAWSILVGPQHQPGEVDPDEAEITLKHDGEVINTAKGSEAAGGQWATLLKAVNNIVGQGYTIEAGHVFTNGALGKIVSLEPGEYHADYGVLGEFRFKVVE